MMMRAGITCVLYLAPALAQISPPASTPTPPATYQVSTPASANGAALAANTTDFWCITGSGSKTVFVTAILVTGQAASSAINARLNLVVRSTANTGGTSSTLTVGPLDSNNAAATATVLLYSVNPAGLGALVGVIKSYVAVQQGAAVSIVPGPQFGFSESWGTVRGVQPITLRGTAQEACLNLNAVTSLTNAMVTVEWYEQ